MLPTSDLAPPHPLGHFLHRFPFLYFLQHFFFFFASTMGSGNGKRTAVGSASIRLCDLVMMIAFANRLFVYLDKFKIRWFLLGMTFISFSVIKLPEIIPASQPPNEYPLKAYETVLSVKIKAPIKI